MKRDYLESFYNIVINISSGWFAVALIRNIFAKSYDGQGLLSMLYNLFMGYVYFRIALKAKEVMRKNASTV